MRVSAVGRLCVVTWASAALQSSASAQSVAQFYAAHRLTIIVASDPGGGYDVYARTFARFIPAYLAGHPAVDVKFITGAGGITAVNVLANEALRDGSAIGAIRAANIIEPLLQQGTNTARYDPRKLNWIGNISKQQGTCFTWHTSPIKTVDETKTRDVTVGSTSPLSNIGTLPNILNALIGTRFKVVAADNLRTALESGKVEGICGMSYSTINASAPEWISGNKLNFLAQTGLQKTAALPDVPMVSEFARNSADRAVFELLDYREVMGRPLMAPPDVPNDRVLALRRAFDDIMRDRDFRAEAKRLNLDVEPTDHKGIETMITSAYSIPTEVVRRTWELMHSVQRSTGPN